MVVFRTREQFRNAQPPRTKPPSQPHMEGAEWHPVLAIHPATPSADQIPHTASSGVVRISEVERYTLVGSDVVDGKPVKCSQNMRYMWPELFSLMAQACQPHARQGEIWAFRGNVGTYRTTMGVRNYVTKLTVLVHSRRYAEARTHGGVAPGDVQLMYTVAAGRLATLLDRETIGRLSAQAVRPEDLQLPALQGPDQPALYPYQVASINAMRRLEHSVADGGQDHVVRYSPCSRIGVSGWALDSEGAFRREDQMGARQRSYPLRGGILANNTGSGKTAVCWGLISAEADRSRAFREGKGERGGTLVIAPPHVIDQWLHERDKFGHATLKVIRMVTMRDFKKADRGEVHLADVVLTTFNFLNNAAHTRLLRATAETLGATQAKTRAFTELLLSKIALAPSSHPLPLLGLFQWHRVVVDELHSCWTQRRHLEALTPLCSRFLWGATATPDLVCNLPRARAMLAERGFESGGHDTYSDEAFVCRAMVLHDGETPSAGVSHRVRHVELTAQERALVHVGGLDSLISQVQACSYFDMSSAHLTNRFEAKISLRNISDAANEIVARLAERQLGAQRRQDAVRLRLQGEESLGTQLRALVDSQEGGDVELVAQIDRVQRNIARLKTGIEDGERSIQRTQVMRSFVSSTFQGGTEGGECPVCMEAYDENAPRVLILCGHSVCLGCVGRMRRDQFADNVKCPTCRFSATPRDMCQIKGATQGGDHNNAVAKYGSKLVTMARDIQALNGESVLLFSQWASHARSIGAALTDHAISCRYMEGSYATRTAILRDFQNGKVQVLIAAGENLVDGVDLHSCSNLIFSHAVVGSNEYVSDTERQMVGRLDRLGRASAISVTHYIARESPESDLYQQTHKNILPRTCGPNLELM